MEGSDYGNETPGNGGSSVGSAGTGGRSTAGNGGACGRSTEGSGGASTSGTSVGGSIAGSSGMSTGTSTGSSGAGGEMCATGSDVSSVAPACGRCSVGKLVRRRRRSPPLHRTPFPCETCSRSPIAGARFPTATAGAAQRSPSETHRRWVRSPPPGWSARLAPERESAESSARAGS